jgi:hypothetical protein
MKPDKTCKAIKNVVAAFLEDGENMYSTDDVEANFCTSFSV